MSLTSSPEPDTGQTERAGFLPARVVHLHASRLCNLACRHCYSSSGPDWHAALDPALVLETLALLREEEYDVLSLSGGEPLLYRGIADVVRGAVALGYQVNLVSNGAPVAGRHLDLIAEYVNLTALSLDGGPATHVDVRGHDRAFQWVGQAAGRLAARGERFGIAYCVSRLSLPDMPWAVEWAEAQGAGLVQFHPFAATGRGRVLDEQMTLSETDKARAYTVAMLLASDDGPDIHVDLAPIEAARTRRADYAVLDLEDAHGVPLAHLVNPLILDDAGAALPLSYGVHPAFAIGQLGSGFEADLHRFKEAGWRRVRTLLDAAFERLDEADAYFVDWFFHVVQTSDVLCAAEAAGILEPAD
jgi:pyruvate-formate lyase-activating enzyme